MKAVCVLFAEQAWGGTLQACRSLVSRGVPTYVAVAGRGSEVYRASRACSDATDLDDSTAATCCEELRRWVEHVVEPGTLVVLIPTSDRLVEFLHTQRSSFGARYRLGIPEPGVAERLLCKPDAFDIAEAAGLSVPAWRRVRQQSDIARCEELRLPVVVRPSSWSTQGAEPFKVVLVRDREMCARALQRLVDGGADVVVQEYVGGDGTAVEFGLSWRSKTGSRSMVCTGVKHREASDDGGVMVWGSAVDQPSTRSATMSFLDSSGFTGLGGAEFIRRMGTLWFIEFNPRLEAITFLATRAGLDLVAAEFDDLAGITEAPVSSPQRPATAWVGSAWLARLTGPSGSLLEALGDRARFALSPNRVKAVWSFTDPGPSVQIVKMMMSAARRRVRRSMRRNVAG